MTQLNPTNARRCLREFRFQDLFIDELGWDNAHAAELTIQIDDEAYSLQAVAQKRGMVVFVHWASGDIPPHNTRSQIERLVAKSHREHFLIFVDGARTAQKWLWVRREPGQPLARRTIEYTPQQSGELLLQKLEAIAFSFDEEAGLSIVDVTSRVRAAFNVERATKKFYDQFKIERNAFERFVQGIPDVDMSKWYVSVMLNRLMFVYFIQRKGFLDGDRDYLRNRLQLMQARYGDDQFYSFYRTFLLRLFHEGLGEPAHDAELEALLGRVPYLNGGIFQLHQVEQQYAAIQISDEAFRRIFDFFDQYQWYLDDRPLRDDREINPDVLGYIFEKYINQKQMGAYYTKEDITGYIGQNTIIPFLFDQAQKECAIAFSGAGSVWRLAQADPDRYIYAAVRHGTERPLPPAIAAGVDDVSRRGAWNSLTPEEYGLPTEIWRETVARRQRYAELHERLAAGRITSINDFITYNLDSVQFAQDVIENCEGPDLLRAFWKALVALALLDPTVGSGAFLFAALNILEPLYEACLERMQAFVRELSPADHPHKYRDFKQLLAQVGQHPNQKYFVLKSIIVNNLYGVDIMPEAVEIAKLRLFLKLAAQVARVEDIEPLPDIDFNIRAGNTLVGFTSKEEVARALQVTQTGQGRLLFGEDQAALAAIEEKAADVDRLFARFRAMQTSGDQREFEAADSVATKKELQARLGALEAELNRLLARQYGVNPDDEKAYQKWQESHQPFHWFTEFYGILRRGGFGVIVGNPPYVSINKINYSIQGEQFPDIYASVLVRMFSLNPFNGRLGMIVPLSIMFSRDFQSLRKQVCSKGISWFSSYDNIPASIFSGVSQRCTIWIGAQKSHQRIFTTAMYRWRAEYRDLLMQDLSYIKYDETTERDVETFGVPKLSKPAFAHMLNTITHFAATNRIALIERIYKSELFFSPAARNFMSAYVDAPPCLDALSMELVPQSQEGSIKLKSDKYVFAGLSLLVGDMFFWYWLVRGDGFHVTSSIVRDFLLALGSIDDANLSLLYDLGKQIHTRRYDALVFKKNAGKYVGNYNFSNYRSLTRRADLILGAALGLSSNDIIDLFDYVDRVLSINVFAGEKGIPQTVKAKFPPLPVDKKVEDALFSHVDTQIKEHYGFTAEELDFIINYDIKYRFGDDLFTDDEEL